MPRPPPVMMTTRPATSKSSFAIPLLSQRQREAEGRALAGHAFEADRPAVQLDEALGERKPETRPFGLAHLVTPDLLEFLEHQCLVLGRDPDAGVLDRDLDPAGVLLRAYVDPPAVGRELHGVGKEVEHDLLELALVGLELADALV